MDQDIEKVLYTEEQIAAHVKELGEKISRDYAGKDVVLVAVLRGAAIFMSDLARQITIPVELDYMAVSSYGTGTTSSGVVRILKDLSSDIAGRHVIIAEDILDTGITLNHLCADLLAHRKPASIEVACMFLKEGAQKVDIQCKYPGLPVPDEFVVGYGLDYAERYRNVPYLGVLKPEVYC